MRDMRTFSNPRTLRTISPTFSAARPFVVPHLCGLYPLAARKGRPRRSRREGGTTNKASESLIQSILIDNAMALKHLLGGNEGILPFRRQHVFARALADIVIPELLDVPVAH